MVLSRKRLSTICGTAPHNVPAVVPCPTAFMIAAGSFVFAAGDATIKLPRRELLLVPVGASP